MSPNPPPAPISHPGEEGEDPGPPAGIVTIGDELLAGERVNSNAAWLARRLSDLGFAVRAIHSVGDSEEEIGGILARAGEEAELVVATGGLGPTLDDRTREAVAARWNLQLREDPEVLERIRTRFLSRGYHDLPETNRRIAQVPEGARVLLNPRGSAPGLLLTLPRSGQGGASLLLLLPGVPREMRALMDGHAGDALRKSFAGRLRPARYRTIDTTGVPESVLAGRIEAMLHDVDGVEVAYRPSLHGVELRLTARGPDAGEALALAERLLEPILAQHRFEAPGGDLAAALGRSLQERGLRVAVAESCTGGLVLKRLTDIPGSSNWVVGGVVAYADRIKDEWLEVPLGLLEAHGAVSEGVARTMAEGIRRRMGVEIGVGVTGIAGPGGEAPGKPVGTVWFAVTGSEGTQAQRIWFSGDREEVRERAAQHALHLTFRYVEGPEQNTPVGEMDTHGRRGDAPPANPGSMGG